MHRRHFLSTCGLTLSAVTADYWTHALLRAAEHSGGSSRKADVLVIGGGLGGCAAALSCRRHGSTCHPNGRDRLDRRTTDLSGRPAGRASVD